jgi:ABC-type transport system involved in Fe-S cluster assembly fused permease/ATPase subunit
MDDSAVQENGTHDDLLKQGGKYAHIWDLQAKPFQ